MAKASAGKTRAVRSGSRGNSGQKSSSGSRKKGGSGGNAGSAPKKKPAASGKSAFFRSKIRFFLVPLCCALIGGAAGIALALYFSQASWFQNERPATYTSSRTPVETQVNNKSGHSVYEETNEFDRQVKRADQILYRIFRDFNIPEKDVRFTELTRMQSNGLEWHHATMGITLPSHLEEGVFIEGLKLALQKFSLESPVTVEVGKQGRYRRIDVRLQEMPTHTLIIRPGTEPEETSELEQGQSLPKVAIIIDDLGLSYRKAECFISLDAPLTISVLPFQKYTGKVAAAAHESGKVVMLHMPMEPAGYPEVDPGQGALLMSMNQADIVGHLRKALEQTPFITGINNHMGSRLTEDAERMSWVMAELKSQGIFFLDSRTTNHSVAYKLARQTGVPAASRNVFLDNVQDEEAISAQIRRLVALARQRGEAVAIGHPHQITCQVLKKEYNFLISKVDLVSITELLE